MLINGKEKNYYPQTSFLTEENPEPKDSDGYSSYVGCEGQTYLNVPASDTPTLGLIGELKAQTFFIMRGCAASRCVNSPQSDIGVDLLNGVHRNVQVKTLSPHSQNGHAGWVRFCRSLYDPDKEKTVHAAPRIRVPYDEKLVHWLVVVNGDFIWTVPIGYINGKKGFSIHKYNRWRHSLPEVERQYYLGTVEPILSDGDLEGDPCL
jgi:hypothetical protein